MTIEIPSIPTQSTTESGDLFLMHNVATNRTKGITYSNLKSELTIDIDHVTAAELVDSENDLIAGYEAADLVVLDTVMPTLTTYPTPTPMKASDYFAYYDYVNSVTKQVSYSTLKTQMKNEVNDVTQTQLTDATSALTSAYIAADLVVFNTVIPTLGIETTIVSGDYIPMYDISATASKKITYNNLKTRLSTDINSVTQTQLTDAVAALTASYTAAITASLQLVFPVGSKISGIGGGASTNPNTYLGFGTWVKEEGYFYVGNESGDVDFQTTGATGGFKAHDHGSVTGGTTLNSSQIPSHSHPYRDRYYAENGLGGLQYWEYLPSGHNSGYGSNGSDWDNNQVLYLDSTTTATGGGGSHNHSISATSNLPPYKVEYVWRRTA